jgi:hypothetical protein
MVAAGIAALPMVPGYFAIDGLHSLLSFSAARTAELAQLSKGLHSFSRAIFISVALIVGVIGPTIIRQDDKEPVPFNQRKISMKNATMTKEDPLARYNCGPVKFSGGDNCVVRAASHV